MAEKGNSHQTSGNWRKVVTSLYPHILSSTYCVPPVHLNKVPYERVNVGGTGQTALLQHPPSGSCTTPVHNVPPTSKRSAPPPPCGLWAQETDSRPALCKVQDSDAQDDFAQNQVLLNLQELASSLQQVMFILSQLRFGDYLNQPAYAAAAAAAQLSQPPGLDTECSEHFEGEFDILLIHRTYGILIGELKSVGRNPEALKKTPAEADADVARKVEKAVKQLDRSERVVRRLVSDVAPGLTVSKTLFLPYVSSAQLQRVLDNNGELGQAVYSSLGAADATEAVKLCCCSDQLSQPDSYWHVTPDVLSQLSSWWQHRMACNKDTVLTDDLYLEIVARFVGPATCVAVPSHSNLHVEARTVGHAAAVLGRRLAVLVLTLQQLALLNKDRPRVCITGPPGTGKTVVLVLQGVKWLRRGCDVQVVSTGYENRAISTLIKHQLELLPKSGRKHSRKPGQVVFHQYDFYNKEADVEKAITELSERAVNGSLYVLLDEAFFVSSADAGPRHSRLVTQLSEKVTHLHLWAACFRHTSIPPALHKETLKKPLRCAPSVLRELEPAVGRYAGRVHEYSDDGVPAPGDGLPVLHLRHDGKGHVGQWPVDCAQCGQDIALQLRRLGVRAEETSTADNPAPLTYRDVFVLTRSSTLQDDLKDEAGKVTSAASGVVRGLRAAGIRVCVLGQQDRRYARERWQRDVQDVAVAATDRVTVCRYGYVTGLERRVVVMLSGRYRGDDDGYSDELVDVIDKLHAVSRCTTQLILLEVPPHSDVTTPAATAGGFAELLVVVLALVILALTPDPATRSAAAAACTDFDPD